MPHGALDRVITRLLAALRLARAAEVDHERRVAAAIRVSERQRAAEQMTAAAAKLQAVEDKLRRSHERVQAEHAVRVGLHARGKRLRERLRFLSNQLEQAETTLARVRASERRLKSVHGAAGERLLGLLSIRAEATRSARVRSAESGERERHLTSISPDYAAATSTWRQSDAPSGVLRVCIGGVRWSVPADSRETGSLSQRILDNGWLPFDDIAMVRQFAVGGVMLDIGANIGTTAIPRVLLGDFECVYAAEPDQNNYLCLVGNTIDNNLAGRILPDRVAISSSDGTARFRKSEKIGGHRLLLSGASSSVEAQEVTALTLDSWVERLGVAPEAVTFVKIDTQGWDLHVLQGARALLRRKEVVWQIEVSPSLMTSEAGSSIADLCALVRAHFTHVKEISRHAEVRWVPASEVGTLLEGATKERRFVNLLLFNFA